MFATLLSASLFVTAQESQTSNKTPPARQDSRTAEGTSNADRELPPVFSGPQKGEKLAALSVRLVGSPEPIDVVKVRGDKPQLLVFLHKLTRPGFQLTRVLATFIDRHAKDKLQAVVVFLTDDPPAAETQVGRIAQLLPKSAKVGVSTDGAEGPGAYGLNRNVLITLLVANKGRVTANYALGQPSANVDGPKIAKSIVEMLGGGIDSDLSEFLSSRMGDQRMAVDRALLRLFRPLMDEKATAEQVAKQIAEIEEYVRQKPARKSQLGQAAVNFQQSPRMSGVKNEKVKEKIKEWAKLARRPTMRSGNTERRTQSAQDPQIRPLLQPLIQKDATDAEVIAAAKKIEDYAAMNSVARGQIGDICRRIIKAEKLSNYGTAKCQEFMKKWAKDFVTPSKKAGTSGKKDRGK